MRKTTNAIANQKGRKFEEEIADLYKIMGYEIFRNVPLNGQEVDVLASRRVPGGGPYNVLVECKFKEQGLVSNADVQSIAGAYAIARARHEVSACTIVTTNGFSLAAQEAAKAAGINLSSKRDIIRALIDFSPYINTLKTSYSEDFGTKDNSWYIETRARKDKEDIPLLDNYLDDWLFRRDKSPLVLLGGYGTGKTSFSRHFAVRLLETRDRPIPVVLPLREFQKTIRMESLIRDFLEDQCNAPSPRFDTFWRMYSEGLLLLILDGFDEMAVRVDKSVLEANLIEIEKFARTVGNLILTCRPEYFVTRKEETSAITPSEDSISDRIAIYERLELALWTPQQINEYVKQRVRSLRPRPSHSAGYYIERIQKLPELADLSERAVHLDLIVKTLPNLIDSRTPITRPNLYQTYIQKEFSRETVQNKRLKVITDESRLALMRAVAAERFVEASDVLDFEAASRIIQANLDLPQSEVESVTRDFLNRSFLHRDGDLYHFAHKSIGEYLFAQELYSRIMIEDFEFLELKTWPSAVASMTLDFFGGTESLDQFLAALKLTSLEPLEVKQIPRSLFAAMALLDHMRGISSVARNLEAEKESVTPRWKEFIYLTHDLSNTIVVLQINAENIVKQQHHGNLDAALLESFGMNWRTFLKRLEDFREVQAESTYLRARIQIEFEKDRYRIPAASSHYMHPKRKKDSYRL